MIYIDCMCEKGYNEIIPICIFGKLIVTYYIIIYNIVNYSLWSFTLGICKLIDSNNVCKVGELYLRM